MAGGCNGRAGGLGYGSPPAGCRGRALVGSGCEAPYRNWFLCIICLYFIAKICTEIEKTYSRPIIINDVPCLRGLDWGQMRRGVSSEVRGSIITLIFCSVCQYCFSSVNSVVLKFLHSAVAPQLSQRDCAAGWGSFGQKWNGLGDDILQTSSPL